MTVELEVDVSNFTQSLEQKFNEIKVPVQQAMAEVFEVMVRMNIGAEEGEYRPSEWSPLSAKYAKRVKRPYATMKLTGTMESTIKSGSDEDAGYVTCGTEYAGAHQYGEGKMPERPFFPIAGGEFTEQAKDECLSAARIKLEEVLK